MEDTSLEKAEDLKQNALEDNLGEVMRLGLSCGQAWQEREGKDEVPKCSCTPPGVASETRDGQRAIQPLLQCVALWEGLSLFTS